MRTSETMPIRISNLRLGVEEPESSLPGHIARVLNISANEHFPWRILRKSLDARDKNTFRFVYSVEVTPSTDEKRIVASAAKRVTAREIIEHFEEQPFELPWIGRRPFSHRPIVIGSGPAGLLAAYFLAELGYLPLVLERGRAVRDRIRDVRAFDDGGLLDPESNYLFGEGGAGTFSDGKLTSRGSGPDVRRVLGIFAACKGKPSILYDYRPHLGSNRLPAVVKAIRRQIEAWGGEIRFSCRVEDLDIADGKLRGVLTSSGYLPADVALLGIGHSARDTYEMLVRRSVPMVQKPFQLGVRIEQPQEIVNRVQYGTKHWEDSLGAADYALIARGRHDLFTFCMCAGGYVMPSVSEPGHFCTNGMSLSGHDSPFANSGLVVTLPTEQFGSGDVLAGVRLQQRYERRAYELGRSEYLCPLQRAPDFLAGRPTHGKPASSYRRGTVTALVAEVVPLLVLETLHRGLPIMDRRWHGRFIAEATLVGSEARGSSPVRILREGRSRETPGIEGLYPIGEGAGYAGGIVSAAVDGLRSAKSIVGKFAPLKR
jgi:uncharacterized FAD-dependent dehydrogenase